MLVGSLGSMGVALDFGPSSMVHLIDAFADDDPICLSNDATCFRLCLCLGPVFVLKSLFMVFNACKLKSISIALSLSPALLLCLSIKKPHTQII